MATNCINDCFNQLHYPDQSNKLIQNSDGYHQQDFLMFGSLKHNHQKVFVYQHFVLVLLTVWLMIVGWLFKEQQLILLIVLHYVIVIINLSGSQPTE